MGDLSRHFSREEFACRCGCGFEAVDITLLGILERCAEHFEDAVGAPYLMVYINSGNRCDEHNATIPGAAPESKHTKGIAVDFRVEGIPAGDVAAYLESRYPGRYGIGRYNGRTHLDMRSDGPARWDNTGR